MAVEVTEEDSTLKLAIIAVDSIFSDLSFGTDIEKTWNEWKRLYEKQKRRFLKGKISNVSFYLLLKRINKYFRSIQLPEDRLLIFPLEGEISVKSLKEEELKYGKIKRIKLLFPLFILLVITILVSFFLMLIFSFQQILISFTDVFLVLGIIELSLGTLAQLGKTGFGRSFGVLSPQKVPMREVETSVDHQVREINFRKQFRSLG
ncbi:MAG: hypothetical protein JSW11_16780 [Candidatus Heimdallarchaeota archaeon]|nr:MAG: hypothetical protein JSW11_16780 [Candidatus Heimdallarchaeota archaeon]